MNRVKVSRKLHIGFSLFSPENDKMVVSCINCRNQVTTVCLYNRDEHTIDEREAPSIVLDSLLPRELVQLITEFIGDKGIRVISENQRLIKEIEYVGPNVTYTKYIDYDSDSGMPYVEEDSIYSTRETMLCRQCFIYGVARCIKTTGKLPTRRRDVNWFTPFKDGLSEEEKRDVLLEYVEPPEHYYMCMRYRSHIPYTNGIRSFITAV